MFINSSDDYDVEEVGDSLVDDEEQLEIDEEMEDEDSECGITSSDGKFIFIEAVVSCLHKLFQESFTDASSFNIIGYATTNDSQNCVVLTAKEDSTMATQPFRFVGLNFFLHFSTRQLVNIQFVSFF
jgi:hypothetical protein